METSKFDEPLAEMLAARLHDLATNAPSFPFTFMWEIEKMVSHGTIKGEHERVLKLAFASEERKPQLLKVLKAMTPSETLGVTTALAKAVRR